MCTNNIKFNSSKPEKNNYDDVSLKTDSSFRSFYEQANDFNKYKIQYFN